MLRRRGLSLGGLAVVVAGCGASNASKIVPHGGGGGADGGDGVPDAGLPACGYCIGDSYTPCASPGVPGPSVACSGYCDASRGCLACQPGSLACDGNEVHRCLDDGSGLGDLVQTCDVNHGQACSDGACADACHVAAGSPSNIGCEFWAVDLDQQDALNDPSKSPWGVELSNVGTSVANVTIEVNQAPPGQPVSTSAIQQLTVLPGEVRGIQLPVRWLDCGSAPNQYTAPGTCLTSNAFRITSSSPIVVYQFNTFTNSYSADASLLLPTSALGQIYRVFGWQAGHFVNLGGIIDRSYVTIVGTQENTLVTVNPTWRIHGSPSIPAVPIGGQLQMTLGPFDVLNLESDDATFAESSTPWVTDLSGTAVTASAPVAVFTGVESAQSPASLTIPTPPGWDSSLTCCLDHLEDQLMPVEAIGKSYVLTRSPLRSTSGWKEPDVVRFVGAAETAHVKTTLPAPYDSFDIAPGEYKTTWATDDVIVDADKPVIVGQVLISQDYVDGPFTGDPSLTIYSPVDQYRTNYVMLSPPSWDTSWVVVAAVVGTNVLLDGASTASCKITPSGTLNGKDYESRVCQVQEGAHTLTGDQPFGIVMYGYGGAGSYAVVGGADVKKIYTPPPIH